MSDFVAQRSVVRGLAEYARELCGEKAGVSESELRDTPISIVEVEPRATDALPIKFIGEQFLVVSVGRSGRWEFDYTTEELDVVRELVEAVVQGRGVEWSNGGIELQHPDGSNAFASWADRWWEAFVPRSLRRRFVPPRRIQAY